MASDFPKFSNFPGDNPGGSGSKFQSLKIWLETRAAKAVLGGIVSLAIVVLAGYMLFKPARPSIDVVASAPPKATVATQPKTANIKTANATSKSKRVTVAKKSRTARHSKTRKTVH